MPGSDYNDMNLPAPSAGQCYHCSKWRASSAPDYCTHTSDGFWEDKCCVLHSCLGDCGTSGRRLEENEASTHHEGVAALSANDGVAALSAMPQESLAIKSVAALQHPRHASGQRRQLDVAGGLSACRLQLPLSITEFTAGDNDQVLQYFLSWDALTGWLISIAQNDINQLICSTISEATAEPFVALLGVVKTLLHPEGGFVNQPLHGEQEIIDKAASEGVALINFFTDPFFSIILPRVNTALGEVQGDGLPRLVQYVEQFTHGDGVLPLTFLGDKPPLVNTISNIIDVSFKLTNVRIAGLDSVTTFNAPRTIGRHTVDAELAAGNLDVRVDMHLTLGTPTGAGHTFLQGDLRLDETFSAKIGLKDLNARAAMIFAVRQDRWESMTLGQLNAKPDSCILSLFYGMNITMLTGLLVDIINPELTGFLNAGVSSLVTSVTDAVFMMYEPKVLEQLPLLLDITVKELLQAQLDAVVAELVGACPPIDPAYVPGTLTLETTSLASIHAYLDAPLGPPSDPSEGEAAAVVRARQQGVDLVDFHTHTLFAALIPLLGRVPVSSLLKQVAEGGSALEIADPFGAGPLLEFTTDTSPNVSFVMGFDGVRVSGLETFSNVDLFHALGSHVAQSRLAASRLVVEAELSILIVLPLGLAALNETFTVSAGVYDLNLTLATLLAINEQRLQDLQLGSLMSNTSNCLRSLLFTANVTQLRATVTDIINPVVDGLLDSGISNLVQGFSDVLFEMFEPGLVHKLPEMLDRDIRALANEQLEQLFTNVPHCPVRELDLERASRGELSLDTLSLATMDTFLASENAAPADPLQGEAAVVGDATASGTQLVDFNRHRIFRAILPALGRLPVASLITELTEGSGTLDLSVPEDFGPLVNSSSGVEVALSLRGVRLSGLDTLSTVDLFNVLSAHVFQSRLAAARLEVSATLSLHLGLPFGLHSIDDTFTVSVGVTNLDATLAALLALDEVRLEHMQLRSLVDTTSSCLLSLVYAANVTQLRAAVLDIINPVVTNFIDAATSDLITSLSDAVLDIYEPGLIHKLPVLLDTTVKRLVNEQLHQLLTGDNQCPQHARTAPPDYLDLDTLSLKTLGEFLSAPNPEPSSPTLGQAGALAQATAEGVTVLDFNTHPLFELALPLLESLDVADLISALTSGTGRLSLAQPFGADSLVDAASAINVTLDVSRMQVSGLDTLQRVELFHVLGPHVFQTSLGASQLVMEMELSLIVELPFGFGKIDETFNVSAGVVDLNATVAALLAINQGRLDPMQLGSILATPVDCLVSLIYAADVTQLRATVTDIINPVVTGLIDSATSTVISSLSDAIMEIYEPGVIHKLPVLLDTTIKTIVNEQIDTLLSPDISRACSALSSLPPENLLDFLKTPQELVDIGLPDDTLDQAFSAIESLVGDVEVDGLNTSKLNGDMIKSVTEAQSGIAGTLTFPALVDVYAERTFFGDFGLKVTNLTLTNLDTLHDVHIARPLGSQLLGNQLRMGRAPRPLTFAFSVELTMKGRIFLDLISQTEMEMPFENNIHNKADIELSVYDLFALVELALYLDLSMAKFLATDQLLSLNCWLSTLRPKAGLYFPQANFSVDHFDLHVHCHECSSPGFQELVRYATDPAREGAMQRTLQQGLRSLASLLMSSEVQRYVEQFVAGAGEKCAADSGRNLPLRTDAAVAPSGLETADEGGFLPAAISIAACLLVLCICCCCSRRRFSKKAKRSKVGVMRAEAHKQYWDPVREGQTTSLAFSPVVSRFARVAIPAALLGNVGLFVTGHLALGATVELSMKIVGDVVNLPPIFSFSMAKSMQDMFAAGAYQMGIMILVFSVLWPYTKIFITFGMWYAPPRCVHPRTRGSTLLWLDALGKWSMIDIFVMVVTLAAFRIHLLLPQQLATLLPDDFLTIDLAVRPVIGLYSNTLAQAVTQLISHWIIYLHRNSCAAAAHESRAGTLVKVANAAATPEPPRETFTTSDGRLRAPTWVELGTGTIEAASEQRGENRLGRGLARERLCAHVFELSGVNATSKTRRFRFSQFGQLSILILMIIMTILLLVGSSVPSFRMRTAGIAGKLLDLGDEGSHDKHYSILSVTAFVSDQATEEWSSQVGIRGICALFIFCSFIVPVLQSMLLASIWYTRLSLPGLKIHMIVCEVLGAWQYLEVYMIAIIFALLQIKDLSKVMMQGQCEVIGGFLQTLFDLGLIEEEHNDCFYVEASTEDGVYYLLGAAVILNIAQQLCVGAANAAIEDREIQMRGESAVPHMTWFQNLITPFSCCIAHESSSEYPSGVPPIGESSVGDGGEVSPPVDEHHRHIIGAPAGAAILGHGRKNTSILTDYADASGRSASLRSVQHGDFVDLAAATSRRTSAQPHVQHRSSLPVTAQHRSSLPLNAQHRTTSLRPRNLLVGDDESQPSPGRRALERLKEMSPIPQTAAYTRLQSQTSANLDSQDQSGSPSLQPQPPGLESSLSSTKSLPGDSDDRGGVAMGADASQTPAPPPLAAPPAAGATTLVRTALDLTENGVQLMSLRI